MASPPAPERTVPFGTMMTEYHPPMDPFLSVIHADEALLVLDKPSGLLTVPGKDPAHDDCLEARARQRFRNARLVHRLDMPTSGLVVMGLTIEAQRHLNAQFAERRVEKTYLALLHGQLSPAQGRVDAPMRCDWPNRPLQMIDLEKGKSAITDWRVIEQGSGITRVRLSPLTGRSHQLRVHMLSLGHPILGDPFYGPPASREAMDRLALHAHRLTLTHPASGARVSFEAPPPF
ncbi:MAG: RluA family pseudouridine synthase [Neomegalonema sp.]|nr:RluA family pseudouridine synthase [Neomegalonema sp.]